MNKLRDVVTIAWKEIQLIAKDRGSLAILFLLPLLIGSMMASMNLQAANAARGQKGAILLKVSMVNQDTGIFGSEIVKALQGINILEMENLDSVELAEDRVARGQAAAAIIIPRDLSDKINAYTPTTLEVIVDPGAVCPMSLDGTLTGVKETV